jgi:hypothetical protein|eukprot:CAMPEP_0174342638 /NCGR_PEP_ID=MMETSP0810-20121108/26325_1 /TAXON_ID=73025 ORGANISM="Eutreptiella gymnastica-like, Strain CCMP1594" /NCGR_SAMPLE_ID=MMETSP0810 /ASSEMBLY_ACC=CAM_ASM_000659 /LENGTH=30 /DNA_ID= /DNA_START= /DNA_END= /DNA_ORIENTATION=
MGAAFVLLALAEEIVLAVGLAKEACLENGI